MAIKRTLLSQDDIRDELAHLLKKSRLSTRKFSAKMDVCHGIMYAVIKGKIEVSDHLAYRMGYKRIRVYIDPKSPGWPLTNDDMLVVLREAIAKSGLCAKTWAKEYGIAQASISACMLAKRPVSERLANYLGYQVRYVYVVLSEAEKASGPPAKRRGRPRKTEISAVNAVLKTSQATFGVCLSMTPSAVDTGDIAMVNKAQEAMGEVG